MPALRAVAILCVLAVFGTAGLARAEQGQQTVRLGGKALSVISSGDGHMQAKVGDDVLEEDPLIEVEASFDDGKSGAAVLLVSDGGSGCPGNYVVISVDDSGKAAVTDPFGTCSDTAETRAENGRLTVRFAPVAGRDGTVYHWSFAKGLEPAVAEPFQPIAGTSWANADGLIGKYPWEALDNADVFAAFKRLLGPDFTVFTDYFARGDPMDVTSDGIIVGTCFEDTTEESTSLLIGVDPNGKRVFAALQDGSEVPRLYPPKGQWPASLQGALKQWQ